MGTMEDNHLFTEGKTNHVKNVAQKSNVKKSQAEVLIGVHNVNYEILTTKKTT